MMTKKKNFDSHGPTTKKQANVWFICMQCLDVFYEGNNYYHHKIASEFQDIFSQL